MTRSTESGRIMLIRKEFAEDGVLIELYWNVNNDDGSEKDNWTKVLIELYWNVNKTRLMDWEQDGDSINRTILECKLRIRLICRSV